MTGSQHRKGEGFGPPLSRIETVGPGDCARSATTEGSALASRAARFQIPMLAHTVSDADPEWLTGHRELYEQLKEKKMTGTAMQKIPTEPTSSGSLVVQGPIGSEDWKTYAQIANIIAKTDFVPKHLRGKPAEIMACILYGRDQGVPAMIALQEIYVVDGHPTMSAHLKAAKVRANGHHIRRSEQRDADGEIVSVTAHGTRDDGIEDQVTWTLKDAERAGLLRKDNWKHYPRQMLWARAVSELCNTLFTDVFLGSIYDVDEVEEALDVSDAMDAEFKEVVAGAAPPPPSGDDDETGGGSPVSDAAEAAASAPPPDLVDGHAVEDSWANYTIPTGHHQDETLGEIAAIDPAWLWGAASYKQGDIGDAIKAYLAEFPNTPKTNPEIPGQENLL